LVRRDWIGLGGWLLLCFGVAAFGAQFEPGSWYAQLEKPPWMPPDWVFAPAWSVLYGSMAVAAWLVWKQEAFSGARLALGLFGLQLVLNAAWSWLFFGLRQPGLALAGIVILWAAILATLLAFWRVRRVAGGLLAPYLGWVTFAAALNFEVWRLN
jgi:translocator protein